MMRLEPTTGPRRWLVRAGASALFLVALVDCGPGPSPRSATPPWMGAPVAAPPPIPSAAPLAVSPEGAHTVGPDDPVFDPAQIRPLLDEPALSGVAAAHTRGAPREAADKLALMLRDSPPADPTDVARWTYLLGQLRIEAGDPQRAVTAYEQAAAHRWVLAGHARLRAAAALVALDRGQAGLDYLDGYTPGTADDREARGLRARAMASLRRIDEAVVIWESLARQEPRPDRWEKTALKAVAALLNQPNEARAEKAVDLARLVMRESRSRRRVAEARELESKALETIPHKRRQVLDGSADAKVARARSLAWSGGKRPALAAAKTAIEALKKEKRHDKPSAASCEAYLARGKALATLKRYQESSDVLGTAINRCEGQARLVVALFVGGRSAARGGRLAAAKKRYAQLEARFPAHRYADDARLHGAEAALKLGDERVFSSMLLRIAEDYPKGDMVDDGLFALARHHIDRGRWREALQPLERAIAHQKRGRPYYAEGRPQHFYARALLELGRTDEGLTALESVVRQFPLSYFMVQSYAHLRHHDPKRAAAAITDAMAAEPEGRFVIPDHGELHRDGFVRAVELVRQGDGERALGELRRLGAQAPDAHPSLRWASAFLLARIESTIASHGLLRGHRQSWREHYPAGVWRPLWEVAYPRPFWPIVEKETQRSSISPSLAYAIMREESAFMPEVVSHAGAYGLMQLILPTAKHVARSLSLTATRQTLKQPAVNVALGCRFLANLQRRFAALPALAIPGYNAGPGGPLRWLRDRPAEPLDLWVERMPYRETRRYTKRVLQSLAAYAMLYGNGMAEPLLDLPLTVAAAAPSDE